MTLDTVILEGVVVCAPDKLLPIELCPCPIIYINLNLIARLTLLRLQRSYKVLTACKWQSKEL